MNTYVQTREYRVVEEFTMGGVEVTAVWLFEVVADEITVHVFVAADSPTPEATVRSGDKAKVDVEDVPRHVVRKVSESAEDDAERLSRTLLDEA